MNPKAALSVFLPLALAATGAIGSVTAQSCGVRNGYRIVNSHSGAGSELAVDTGWQTAAPLITPGSNSNIGPVCASQGSCTPTSDYGLLRCVGSGTANNCPTSGAFLWLDQAPQARFRDTLTVVSSTLPHGAAVQLRAAVALDGFASVNDPSPSVSYGAQLNAGPLSLAISNAPGTTAGVINTTVGASLTVLGNLNVTLYGYGLLGLGNPPLHTSYAVNLTARMGVTSMTPGASLTSCSGRTYSSLAAEVSSVGGGCGAGSPVLAATLPTLGQTQGYTVASSIPNQPVFFAYSFGSAGSTSFGPCTVVVDLVGATSYLAGGTDGLGTCNFGLSLPAAPGLAGVKLTTQTLVMSPGGPMLGAAQLSNGLEVALGF